MVRTLMIQWHAARKRSIDKRLEDAYGEALDAAKQRIIAAGFSESAFNVFREEMTGELGETSIGAELESAAAAAAADETDAVLEDAELDELNDKWQQYCRPWHVVKIEQLLEGASLYPKDDRILPTRLGNVMRATEDRLKYAEDDVQGFVLRRYAAAPRPVQLQHDEFRNRLDMYCIMVFVSGALALLTPLLLVDSGVRALAVVMICGIFVALSVASYGAAIASAGGYCAALKEMDKNPGNPVESVTSLWILGLFLRFFLFNWPVLRTA